ncbi:hypothetical protein ABEP42_27175 [Priestia megaterium]|uniref:hypothetical protein n=1 Tax=Priestia megaterium TaxID=1404 RepID=UPI003179F370
MRRKTSELNAAITVIIGFTMIAYGIHVEHAAMTAKYRTRHYSAGSNELIKRS